MHADRGHWRTNNPLWLLQKSARTYEYYLNKALHAHIHAEEERAKVVAGLAHKGTPIARARAARLAEMAEQASTATARINAALVEVEKIAAAAAAAARACVEPFDLYAKYRTEIITLKAKITDLETRRRNFAEGADDTGEIDRDLREAVAHLAEAEKNLSETTAKYADVLAPLLDS